MDLADTPKRRRGQELEDALLAAAWEQLTEGGYSAFTIEAVAERAQTSRPVIYRRWPDRNALVLAALRFGIVRDRVEAPDTGTLRGDLVETLRLWNIARTPLIPLVSVQLGAYYAETGTTFADIRQSIIGERSDGGEMNVIYERAIARGEIDPNRLTPRIATLPFDLFRHDVLMTLKPITDTVIDEIVDEVFLPLVRPDAAPVEG
ncbi:TetR/AcrR family transcriptional regulator [Leifsonia sp. Leaf264]|uniref:TetR/AcrR family transcriptional regulator n=1 Tax=Leifsonia sp. Leaf264 TaxID=1736314 RepID=UPI0006F2BCC3|nr:TetR/AcrR family transcriptional regulator [Leifsonia sp. Leaf264]KQO97705.1 TetR family transcriptional regulator [Leifsonia sp. Leaf264]